MSIFKTWGAKKPALIIGTGSIILLVVTILCPPLFAADEINIKKDKDKTVYSIGSDEESRKEEEKKQEKSWEMLKNMPIIMDRPVIMDRRTPEPVKK